MWNVIYLSGHIIFSMGYADRPFENCIEVLKVMQSDIAASSDTTRTIDGVLYPASEWVVTCKNFDPLAETGIPLNDNISETD
jgi:hypothetical protein